MARRKNRHNQRRHSVATPSPRSDGAALNSHGPERDGWIRMKVSAKLLEDAHFGSGAGGGGIDALVARDRRDRPVIWASHLEGVLRDAARRLRGEEAAGDFFGRAGGQQQRAAFTSLYAVSAPNGRIWRATARTSFDNRAPKDDTLRAVECVPKGMGFEGQVQLPAADLPLLRRLIQEVDALGRGRASGSGRVTLSLAETARSPRAVGPATSRLVLLLRSLDPLCITATATPDNLVPSLAFVPGRALLGALAGWLVAEGCRDAATLLVNGRVSVSDALPVPQTPAALSAAEVLPAPLSLQSEKPAASGPVPWWAQAPSVIRRLDSKSPLGPEQKLKRPEPDLFVYRSAPAEPWIAFRPRLRVRLRNGRPDPNQADPALFAIEQIVEDTSFLCEIRGTSADMGRLAAALKPVLEGSRWLRVGRAGAPVEIAKIAWSAEPSPIKPPSCALLTLTSDLLVRDEYLRWCVTLDGTRFRQLPGWPADIRVEPLIQDTVAVHGFNGTSRLWRMPAHGIRRGSVFKVEGEGVVALADMMARGNWLGERTHEGFGRFRLDGTLPGCTDGPAAPQAAETWARDEPEEAVAKTTRQWLPVGSASERWPSLSQWLDLVSDLERDYGNALTPRLRSWNDPAAKEILNRIKALHSAADRTSHARLFVRWLRAAMRGRNGCPHG